jgi:hypothetical protein
MDLTVYEIKNPSRGIPSSEDSLAGVLSKQHERVVICPGMGHLVWCNNKTLTMPPASGVRVSPSPPLEERAGERRPL